MSIPQQQKALFLESQPRKAFSLFLESRFPPANLVVQTTPVPKPGSGKVLVKVKATALDPIDWKSQDFRAFISDYLATVGAEFAGEVAALGEGVTKLQVGDRVLVQAKMTKEYSSFQQYALADDDADRLAKIPSNLTFDQAVSIPFALTDAYLTMYNARSYGVALTNPVDPVGQGYYKGEPFVVLGGTISDGQFAIQFAKISGFSPIITTASAKHTDDLKSLGVTHVLDRNLSPAALKAEVEKVTNKPIQYVYDTISSEETQTQGDAILALGGYLMLVYTTFITASDKHFVAPIPLRNLYYNLKPLALLYEKLPEWWKSGVIQPNKMEVVTGGLGGIAGGLKRMKDDQVSGVLLVARPEETN